MYLNKQTPEKPVKHPRGCLDIQSIYPTIQGEGPYQGCPATFVRLAGCNLQCPDCDTDYTSSRSLMNPVQLCTMIKQYNQKLVVITGGEPFRQELVYPIRQLLSIGCEIQIETNGTIMQPGLPYNRLTIVCSPKTPSVSTQLKIDYYKYVIDHKHVDEDDGLPTSVLGLQHKPARPRMGIPVYVQPADSQNPETNAANIAAAIDSCMRFNYRLCIQLHKLIGLE